MRNISKSVRLATTEPELKLLSIEYLLLDTANPRLKTQRDSVSQIELAQEIASHFNALELARLIAYNGFYRNEALLVYPGQNGKYIVSEGNRRLTALLGLKKSEFRAAFQQKSEWNKLAVIAEETVPDNVPVYIFPEPTALKPILAASHLNRKLSWEPFQKAREIVNLVDVEGYKFSDISDFSGIATTELKRMYRDFKLSKNLSKSGFSEVLMTSDFSKIGEITKIRALRELGGIPEERDIKAGHLELDPEKTDNLIEIFEFVYGDDSVTPDSRQIRVLGKVMSDEVSRDHLRSTRDLDEAHEVFKLQTEGSTEAISKSINRAVQQIERALNKIPRQITDPELIAALERVKDLGNSVTSVSFD